MRPPAWRARRRRGAGSGPTSQASATSAQVSRRTRSARRRDISPSARFGESAEQHLGDGEAQHPVAQELQALVAAACRARRGADVGQGRAPGARDPGSGGRSGPRARRCRACGAHARRSMDRAEHAVPAHRPGPLPDLPGGGVLVDGEEDDLGAGRPGSRRARSRRSTRRRLSVELSRLSPIMKKWPGGTRIFVGVVPVAAVAVALDDRCATPFGSVSRYCGTLIGRPKASCVS